MSAFQVGDFIAPKDVWHRSGLFEKKFVYQVRDTRSDHLADIKVRHVGEMNRDGTDFDPGIRTTVGDLWSYSSDFELVSVDPETP
ncbi:hypothetical protein [Lentzea flava]|uniref:Uncharacterized protein n=1 Tax=Lentzea flava TaxID=103732 RepID=A0ABQ2UN81_9PSEU|nr:hypothetical protein [Lentzea flava]MCP2200045.1 hypothetical protein [Lentzea flava]GGU45773.1 hypothetical protein GCM10010178_42790 [Lentzea flava]